MGWPQSPDQDAAGARVTGDGAGPGPHEPGDFEQAGRPVKQLGHLRGGVVLVRPLVPAQVCKEVATQLRAQGGSQGARRAPGLG